MSSYWKIFRIIFPLFSLYLLGDTFYRWDGFSYYASFTQFIPSIALIAILWTTIAAILSLLLWAVSILSIKILNLAGARKIGVEHFLALIILVMLSGAAVFVLHKLWPGIIGQSHIKKVVLSVTVVSVLLIWLFRNKIIHWFEFVQERITPLVWIFGTFFIISVPLVSYHTWFIKASAEASPQFSQVDNTSLEKPNIILVTFDALTARNMSVYGYHRPTTPFLAELSEKASLFTNLHAEANSTRPTSESLMTGKRVWTHGTYGLENYYDAATESKTENIGHLLKVNGYYNVALIQNYLASPHRMGMSDSFDEIPHSSKFFRSDSFIGMLEKNIDSLFGNRIIMHDWLLKSDFLFHKVLYHTFLKDLPANRKRSDLVFEQANKILDKNIPEPFFLWIHLYPPHDPYLPPQSYVGMFDTSPELRTAKSQFSVQAKVYGRNHLSPHELQPIIQTFNARYDEFIRYCDDQFRDFIQSIKEKGVFDDALIVYSSDHGEIFDHDNILHGATLFEPETHIPLIIKEPNQTRGRVIDDLVEQIDIPATILDIVGIPLSSWIEGRSLKPLLHGKPLEPQTSFSVFAVNNPSKSPLTKGMVSAWEGEYKLIHNLTTGESYLYNLSNDPYEKNNLYTEEPERGARLLKVLKNNLKAANDKIKEKGLIESH